MATYTETFTAANGDLGTVTTDLTWNVVLTSTPRVESNKCTTAAGFGGVGLARAEHDSSSQDVFVQADFVTTASFDTLFLIGRAGSTSEIDTDPGVFLFVFRDGAGETDIELGGYVVTGSIATSHLVSSPDATWRLELEGDTARGYRNGVLVLSGSISGAVSPTPSGTRSGFEMDSGAATHPTIDSYTFGDLSGGGATGSATPARTSDVPFLNANDRYQVVACVDAGTSTTTAEFRYWFSGAPEWDLSLNSDTQYPPFHTLDENSTYPPASVETPFKSIKTGQEDQIQGVYVEFVARPTALTEATVTSTYSVGFTARVEGISVPDWNRTVGTTVLTSGVVVSTNQMYETTAEVHDSSAWPNLRSAFLPCRLIGKVRAARVILTDVHLVAIRRIQLVGKLTPGRDA